MKDKIAVFGFKDSLVGQFFEMSEIKKNYDVKYIISTNTLPNINVEKEHIERPNKKTEFISNNKIFHLKVIKDNNYIERLLKDKISKVFVLEDEKILRKEIINRLLNSNIEVLSFIHKSVWLGGHNEIGEGVIVFPMSYIGYKTDIKKGTIIQSNSIIEHHCVVGEFCDINPRVTTGGFTKIGNRTTISISTTIINRIKIGNNCFIGASSLVLKNIEDNSFCYGSPCKIIKKISKSSKVEEK